MNRKKGKVLGNGYFQEVKAFTEINSKVMTPRQYAEFRGCTLQNITKHIRAHNYLPGVVKIKKCSRFYLLEME